MNDIFFDPENFKELIELFPKIEEAYLLGLERERKKYYQFGEKKSVDMNIITPSVNWLRKRWTSYILFAISLLKNPFFNDLKNGLPKMNSRTLTSRLNTLTKLGVITRNIHDTRPVRVSYSLTSYGERLISLHVSILLYIKRSRIKENIFQFVDEI
ncbi:MAG: winged helix-turn-helix transcriptional regulator [Promethearchaeota archaeon]